jgi:hypothetical protein
MGRQVELKFSLDDLKSVVHEHLHLEDDRIVDIMTAVYIANRFNADPLWMQIVAPPSNAKTELLRAFDGYPQTQFISNLTPSALVSGTIPKGEQPDPSLVYHLNNKLAVLKDFTTILSMRHENQQEIIAQLREMYDGQYSKIFGNGKRVEWNGKFGLLAACTPVWDKHYGLIGTMGDRFLLYRSNSENGRKTGMCALTGVGYEGSMREKIRKALHRFIGQFEKMKSIQFENSEEVKHKLVDLACFCAVCRCPVHRDPYKRDVLYQPEPEGTPRLVKQFAMLGMGLALAHGKTSIDESIFNIIKKVGVDLVPPMRMKLIRYLHRTHAFEFSDEWRPTPDVIEATGIPGRTANEKLEDLMVVGAVNRKRGATDGDDEQGRGRPPWLWQISNTLLDHAGGAEVLK